MTTSRGSMQPVPLKGDTGAVNQAKCEFLSLMSHEFRTPLHAVLGYADIIRDGLSGPVTAKQRDQLGKIHDNAQHLLGIVEEMLLLVRVEAGQEGVQLHPCEAGSLARTAGALVESEVTGKGLLLEITTPSEPIPIRSDAIKLRCVLRHLLSNAAKYTSRGRVELRVFSDPDAVRFQVRDTGVGIDSDHLEIVFEPFTQLAQCDTRIQDGTGLGLTLARRLARLLGGDITVESTPGEGSTFTLWLPTGSPRAAMSQIADKTGK